jgi:heterodisulfide reductase subunit A-like polyferredoxin
MNPRGLAALSEILDMLVVGGCINGVGIARDAAGRGLSVRLVEKRDLAGATSSASSKPSMAGCATSSMGRSEPSVLAP